MNTLIPERTNVEIMNDLTSGTITVDVACDQLFRYLLGLKGEKPAKGKIEYVQPRPDANKVFIGLDGKRKTPVLRFVIPPSAQPLYPALAINYAILKHQAHRGNLAVMPTPKDDPTLHMIAGECGLPLDEMADAIKRIAKLIDDDGNTGMSTGRLQRADVGINTKWLSLDYPEAWNGIIFYNEERAVWQCRKNPFWLKVWCQRYADPGSDCVALAEKEAQQKVLAAKEQAEDAKLPKRATERHVQGDWDRLTTEQVAERFWFAYFMRWHEHALFHRVRSEMPYPQSRDFNNLDFMNGYASCVWEQQETIMAAELKYRAASGDDEAKQYLDGRAWIDSQVDRTLQTDIMNGKQLPPPYFKQPITEEEK